MSDLKWLLICLAVGHLLAQLVVIIFYDKLANLDWRRRRDRRGLGRRVTLPNAEEWIPGDPPPPVWPPAIMVVRLTVEDAEGYGQDRIAPRPDVIPKPQPSGGRLIRGDQEPPNPDDRCDVRAYWDGFEPRSITFPDPDPSRRPTNPYTGKPVQPNPPPSNP